MRRLLTLIFILSLLWCSTALTQQDEGGWTHFRGSKLNGICTETGFQTTWSDTSNISWKITIPGKGWSSPVIYGNQVWVTTAAADGKDMSAICTDFKTGKSLFNIRIFQPDSVHEIHEANTCASPTPCIEKGFLYVHFGTYGTACINTQNGRIVWKRTDLNCDHQAGPGSSPILYKNLLILHLDGIDVQFIIALDKLTGKTIWKTERPRDLYDSQPDNGKKSYITPILITLDGKDLLISNGSAACFAIDLRTGKEVWRIVGGEGSSIPMAAESNGKLFFFMSNLKDTEGKEYLDLMAVDPRGEGDLTKTNILWRVKFPITQIPSPLVVNGLIYVIDSRSNLSCIDAGTGATVWSKKLRGRYNSSPVWAEGHIYISSSLGETYVIREGRKYEMISCNKTLGGIWATPAFYRNSIILRSDKYLYKIR